MGVVMIKCPNTGKDISTGIETDASSFAHVGDVSRIRAVRCAGWSTPGGNGKPG